MIRSKGLSKSRCVNKVRILGINGVIGAFFTPSLAPLIQSLVSRVICWKSDHKSGQLALKSAYPLFQDRRNSNAFYSCGNTSVLAGISQKLGEVRFLGAFFRYKCPDDQQEVKYTLVSKNSIANLFHSNPFMKQEKTRII